MNLSEVILWEFNDSIKRKTEHCKGKFPSFYISSSIYESDWHSTPHAHHCTEIFYVIKGNGSFLVNEDVFDVKEDDLIIVNPNVMHTEMSKGGNPLQYIVLGIEGLQFTSLSKQEELDDYSVHNYCNYKHEVLFYMKNPAARSKLSR